MFWACDQVDTDTPPKKLKNPAKRPRREVYRFRGPATELAVRHNPEDFKAERLYRNIFDEGWVSKQTDLHFDGNLGSTVNISDDLLPSVDLEYFLKQKSPATGASQQPDGVNRLENESGDHAKVQGEGDGGLGANQEDLMEELGRDPDVS